MLAVHFREPHQFSPHELRLVDICARQAADAISVSQLQQALREADRRKDEFLAMLGHELRNPLTPIHNALQVLKRASLPVQEVERLHGLIERQASHLVRIVDDLLDVARITRGKIELQQRPVELKDVVRDALDATMPLFEAKSQRIDVSLPEEPLIVDGDPVRLSQVFSNLLNNGSKYTQAGGHVALSARRDGDAAIVTVRDNGVGFASSELTRAFELFAQGEKPSGNGHSGIGVGLALARGLVDLHGGAIEALSDGKGKGSELRVRLPLSDARSSVADPAPARSEPRPPLERVLIVDDQRDVAESLALLVQSLGAEAKTAANGPAALAAIAKFKPELAIVDIGLSGMSGYDIAREIRKLPEKGGMVLVALSGWGQEEVRKRALEAGFDHFYVKPIDIEALTGLIGTPPSPEAER